MLKLYKSILWSGLTLSLCAGTAVSQQSKKQESPQIQTSKDRPPNAIQSIAREVRHELLTLPYYDVFDWLEGQVKPDGTVVLRGETVRPTLKSDAEKEVRKIESVPNVVNEIRVLPLSSFDDDIRRATYRALFKFDSPLMRYGIMAVPPIHIIVENGHVTLKGMVANPMDKQLAETAARGVPGTFEVKNELQVEKASDGR